MWLLAALARIRTPAHEQQADAAAVGRVAAGDPAALAELYDRHARVVYSLALRIVQDQGDAEDVAQDVFAQAWRQAARYDAARGAVGAWLLTMTRSRAIDRVRARRARPETTAGESTLLQDAEAPGTDVAGDLVSEEQAQRVRDALQQLPLLQRMAIELAFYEGLSQREIAERLEQPLGTVKTRIRLGLLKLRDALGEAPL